eukprot:s282_g26.t1
MEVCFLASGESVARFDAADFEGKTGKAVKQALAAEIGVTRFRQRLFLENGALEIPDDEVFASVPEKIQLVVMAFCPPNAEEEGEMMWAASENDTAGLEEMLKRPLNPEARHVLEYDDDASYAKTALHYAAAAGHVEPMLLLLEARAEINADALGIFGKGMAPLHLAARNGQLDAVRFLIENGARKDQTDNDKDTALERAAECCNFDIARFLIQRGANKDSFLTDATKSYKLKLLLAARQGYEEMVRFLVEVGVDKEQTDYEGLRPLHIAAQEGHLEIVRFLVECGASRNSTTNAGKTALDLASEHGRADIARFLSELDSQSPRRKVRRVGSDRPEE